MWWNKDYVADGAGWYRPSATSYTGPGDLGISFTFWGGFRAYSLATAGTKAIRVQATDTTQTDINTLANGTLDKATLDAFILAHGACKVVTIYDKVGTNDLTQGNDSLRPLVTANALNSSYGMTSVNTTPTVLAAATTITRAQPYSLVTIANVQSGGSNPSIITVDSGFTGAGLYGNSTTNLFAFAGSNLAQAMTAGFNDFQVVFDATTTININGTETTGSAGTNSLSAAVLSMPGDSGGNLPFNGVIMEGGYVAGTITSPQRSSLHTNMHSVNAYGGW